MKKVITIIILIHSIFSYCQNIVSKDSISEKSPKIKILVLQCSNGYGLNDFRNIIEKEIGENNQFEIIPFPNKNLLGITFQGVYDKKYCKPISEKIDVDYIIMTRYLGNIIQGIELTDEKTTIWGYEIKILNTKNWNQKVSIRKDDLKKYEDILVHIEQNSDELINDIKELK